MTLTSRPTEMGQRVNVIPTLLSLICPPNLFRLWTLFIKLTCPLEWRLPTLSILLSTRPEETAILSILTGLPLPQAFGPVARSHYPLLRQREKPRSLDGPQTLLFPLLMTKPPFIVVRNLLGATLPKLPIIWPQLTTANRPVGKYIVTKQPHLLLLWRPGPRPVPLVFIKVVVVS